MLSLDSQVYGKYEKSDAAYPKHHKWSSWHGNDAKVVQFIWQHKALVGNVGLIVFVALIPIVIASRTRVALPPGQLWYLRMGALERRSVQEQQAKHELVHILTN